jgi:hypothetical protein
MNDTAPTPHILQSLSGMALVPRIEPVDGWTLLSTITYDGDGFPYEDFFAARQGELRVLQTCRFRFSPSQERFAWLVRGGFPQRDGKILGPWDDTDIEAALAAERRAA